MYYEITNSIKKRLVLVFDDILKDHPMFREQVDVFTRFPDEERPKQAVLIRSISGGNQKMGLGNFAGIHRGICSLANFKGSNAASIEWVKEDTKNIEKIGAPGYYIVKITQGSSEENQFKFNVTPYFQIDDEVLDIVSIRGSDGALLKNSPVNPYSEKIFAHSGETLRRDFDYTINYGSSEIIFNEPVKNEFDQILIDYQIIGNTSEECDIKMYEFNGSAIPSVLIAFGDRIKTGDEQIVIVEKEFREVANIMTGRWTLTADIFVVAQDPDTQERLADYLITKLWADWEDNLIDDGIYVHDFSLGGEVEDLEVEVAEEYNFTSSISVTIDVDWEVHHPIINEIRNINLNYGEDSFKSGLTNSQMTAYETNQSRSDMASSEHNLGIQLVPASNPVIINPSTYINKIPRKYK